MNHRIEPIPESDLPAYFAIVANAYPAMDILSPEKQAEFQQRMEFYKATSPVDFWGVYQEATLVGGMMLHDFTMNLRGQVIPAAGLGMVAVDLLHKKEHVARDMVAAFIRSYREQGVSLSLLYPFRPDFYRQMGYGYGAQAYQYRVPPAALPHGSKDGVRYLSAEDDAAISACYERAFARTSGLIARRPFEVDGRWRNPNRRAIGCEIDGVLCGYAFFVFDKIEGGTWLNNHIVVQELVYDSPEALARLLSFLHIQFDQIERIVFTTQDEGFYFMLNDVRDGSGRLLPSIYHQSNTAGVGLMYRASDVPALFMQLEGYNFNGVTARVRFVLEDSFIPENDGGVLVYFEDGRASLPGGGPHDVEVRLKIAEFSSLLVGAVDFARLQGYGLVEVSDPQYIDILDALFYTRQKPVCMTAF